jgi:magnesium chelatase family protein
LICPAAQGSEARWASGIDVLAAPDLISLLAHLKGTSTLPIAPMAQSIPAAPGPDLRQVKGQETASRALEIAAAGGHNLLMVGPPGAGKSLLASCLPGILPPLDAAEALEVSMIASVAGSLEGGRIARARPFRAPPFRQHGRHDRRRIARPARRSVDGAYGCALPRRIARVSTCRTRSLRQPLETGEVSVARANAHVTYPARVQLIAAMNPCRCGYLSDPGLGCSRAPRCGSDYQGRVSGPLLDRIDLHVDVDPVSALDLALPPPKRAAPMSPPAWPGPARCNATGWRAAPCAPMPISPEMFWSFTRSPMHRDRRC